MNHLAEGVSLYPKGFAIAIIVCIAFCPVSSEHILFGFGNVIESSSADSTFDKLLLAIITIVPSLFLVLAGALVLLSIIVGLINGSKTRKAYELMNKIDSSISVPRRGLKEIQSERRGFSIRKTVAASGLSKASFAKSVNSQLASTGSEKRITAADIGSATGMSFAALMYGYAGIIGIVLLAWLVTDPVSPIYVLRLF
jgi:hypothetical protein